MKLVNSEMKPRDWPNKGSFNNLETFLPHNEFLRFVNINFIVTIYTDVFVKFRDDG